MGLLSASNKPESQWEQLVSELEAYNRCVEIGLPCAYEADAQGMVEDASELMSKVWKVRLLKVHHGQWTVERPPIAGRHTGGLIPGVTLIGLAVKDAARWSFRTSILRSELHELNARRRVPALRLSPPRDIGTAQRRQFFRVSTVGASLTANLWPLQDVESCIAVEDMTQLRLLDEPLAAGVLTMQPPQLGAGFHAGLVDISAGGAAVLVPREQAKVFERYGLFWMEMMLPTNHYPLVVAATPVHVRREAGAGMYNVGLRFYHEHNQPYERFVQENICHYAAWEQRRQLHRSASH